MEKDIGKIKKNDFTDIVIRLDDFGGRPGVTIREFVKGDRYTGFTKSGVKIQATDLASFKEMINSIKDSDFEGASTTPTSKPSAPAKRQKTLDDSDDSDQDDDSEEDTEEMPDY